MLVLGLILVLVATGALVAALVGGSNDPAQFDLGLFDVQTNTLGVFLIGAATVLLLVLGLELIRAGLRRASRRRQGRRSSSGSRPARRRPVTSSRPPRPPTRRQPRLRPGPRPRPATPTGHPDRPGRDRRPRRRTPRPPRRPTAGTPRTLPARHQGTGPALARADSAVRADGPSGVDLHQDLHLLPAHLAGGQARALAALTRSAAAQASPPSCTAAAPARRPGPQPPPPGVGPPADRRAPRTRTRPGRAARRAASPGWWRCRAPPRRGRRSPRLTGPPGHLPGGPATASAAGSRGLLGGDGIGVDLDGRQEREQTARAPPRR